MLDFTELLVSSTLAGNNEIMPIKCSVQCQEAQETVAIITMNYNHKHVFSLVTCRNEANHDKEFYFQITTVEYD